MVRRTHRSLTVPTPETPCRHVLGPARASKLLHGGPALEHKGLGEQIRFRYRQRNRQVCVVVNIAFR